MFKKWVLNFIVFYQNYLSPLTHTFGGGCRFSPTCSEYTYQAISRYGILRGSRMGLGRVLRCHPWSKGGWDPIEH